MIAKSQLLRASLAVPLALALSGLVVMSPAAAADQVSVGTWAELENAINQHSDVEITLTRDLVAGKTLNIDAGKKVRLLGGKTIYRDAAPDAPFLSMFNVKAGGSLAMGSADGANCVSMSGNTVREEFEILPAKPIDSLDPVVDAERRFVLMAPGTDSSTIYTVTPGNIGKFSLGRVVGNGDAGVILKKGDYPYIEQALLKAGPRGGVNNTGNAYFNPSTGAYFGLEAKTDFIANGFTASDFANNAFSPSEPAKTVDFFFTHYYNSSAVINKNWVMLDASGRAASYFVTSVTNSSSDEWLQRRAWGPVVSGQGRYVQLREVSVTSTPPTEHRYTAAELGMTNDRDALYKGGFFINNLNGNVDISCGTFSDFTTERLPVIHPGHYQEGGVTDWSVTPGTIAPIYNQGPQATFTMTGGTIQNNEVGLNDRMQRDGLAPKADYNGDGLLTFEEVKAKAIELGDAKDPFKAMDSTGSYYNHGTRSAGAIIFNDGVTATLAGAQILNNKGDAGGLIVNRSNVTIEDGTTIDGNEGLYLGGAMNINSKDAKGVTMNGGEISNNKSIRQGAVYAVGPAGSPGGMFVLNGGSLHDNYTLDKGGAIRVASNAVTLNGGEIFNNKSWIMGGAIYVNGDSPQNSRTLVLNDGSIYNNTAVGKVDDSLDGPTDDSRVRGFVPASGGGVWVCPFGTFVFDPSRVAVDDNTAHSGIDFFKETGLGGGLLAPDLDADWKNEANEPLPGNKLVEGKIALTNGATDERAKGVKIYNNTSRRGGGIGADGTLIFGTLKDFSREQTSLEFTKTFADGVTPPEEIYVSLKAKASDGFVSDLGVFKLANAAATPVELNDPTMPADSAGTGVTPLGNWKFQIELPTNIRTANGEEALLPDGGLQAGDTIAKDDFKIIMQEVTAEGAPQNKFLFDLGDVTVTGSETQTQTASTVDTSGATHETKVTFSQTRLAQAGTNTKAPEDTPEPTTFALNATKQFLAADGSDATAQYLNSFTFELKEKKNGQERLVASAKNGVDNGATVAFPEITYTEAGDYTYVITEKTGTDANIEYDTKSVEVTVSVTNENGKLVASSPQIIDGKVSSGFVNREKPTTPDNPGGDTPENPGGDEPGGYLEKYVDKRVHSDLAAFDSPFEYDIMAYVTPDADKVVVSDTLVDSLKFVSEQAEVKAFAMGAENNHLDTVKNTGEAIDSAQAVIDGQKLTVTIEDATAYRGQWVRVNFRAVIDAATRTSVESFGADWAEITKNTPVLIEDTHAGVKNTASYKVFVKNPDGTFPQYPGGDTPGGDTPSGDKPKYEDESNTVTVTPPTQELTVAKKWADSSGAEIAWPADVDSVTVDVYSVKDGKETKLDGKSVTLSAAAPSAKVSGLITLEGVTYTVKEAGASNNEIALGGKTYTVAVAGSTVTNTEKPTTPDNPGGDNPGGDDPINPGGDQPGGNLEKYVNKDVHSDLDYFDSPFEYDIMAFVPEDADKVVVEDTLVDSLKFVSEQAEVKAFAMGAENDHKTTVASEGAVIASAQAVIEGQKLTVTIPDATDYRGQWVRVNFQAVIDTAVHTTLESLTADTATIAANTPVLIDGEHTGVKNTASYKVFVKNPDGTFPQYPGGDTPGGPGTGGDTPGGDTPSGDKPKYEDESNTVTVTPPTEDLKIQKLWKDQSGAIAWPAGVDSVTVDVYSVKDGAETKLEGKSVELSAAAPSATVSGLPKLTGVTYTVKEAGVGQDGTITLGANVYTATVEGTTVTNTKTEEIPPTPTDDGDTFEPNENGKAAIQKLWKGTEATWPEGVSVTLDVAEAGTNTVVASVTLDSTKPSAVVEGLKVGTSYTVVEREAANGEVIVAGDVYKVSVAGSTVTNTFDREVPPTPTDDGGTFEPNEKGKAAVQKLWKGADGTDIAWPEGVTVTAKVYKAGVNGGADEFVRDVVLNAETPTVEIADLEVGASYRLVEQDASEGEVIVAGDVYKVSVAGSTVTNTFDREVPPTPTDDGGSFEPNEKGKAAVQKLWKGADGTDIAWPEGAVVMIDVVRADNGEKFTTVELKSAEPVVVSGLEKGVAYTLVEQDASEGEVIVAGDVYKVSVAGSTVTNTFDREVPPTPTDDGGTFEPNEKGKAAIQKLWKGKDGADIAWPEGAVVMIDVVRADNGEKFTTVELKSAEPVVVSGLEKGVAYTLVEQGGSIGEIAVAGGIYTVSVAGSTVTNTFDRDNPDNPDGDNPGGDEPDNPGGDNPGGDNPGGNTPGNPGGTDPKTPKGPRSGSLAKTGFALGTMPLAAGLLAALGIGLVGARKRRED